MVSRGLQDWYPYQNFNGSISFDFTKIETKEDEDALDKKQMV